MKRERDGVSLNTAESLKKQKVASSSSHSTLTVTSANGSQQQKQQQGQKNARGGRNANNRNLPSKKKKNNNKFNNNNDKNDKNNSNSNNGQRGARNANNKNLPSKKKAGNNDNDSSDKNQTDQHKDSERQRRQNINKNKNKKRKKKNRRSNKGKPVDKAETENRATDAADAGTSVHSVEATACNSAASASPPSTTDDSRSITDGGINSNSSDANIDTSKDSNEKKNNLNQNKNKNKKKKSKKKTDSTSDSNDQSTRADGDKHKTSPNNNNSASTNTNTRSKKKAKVNAVKAVEEEKGEEPYEYPYEVDDDDHCETPAAAYKHIANVLEVIADKLGKTRDNLRIYDPYHCQGAVIKRLAESGFNTVHNKKEDFYLMQELGKIPEYDVLLTNPPYSADHMQKLLQFVCSTHKPWLLLVPNYVCAKDYYYDILAQHHIKGETEMVYIVPESRYKYTTPNGRRQKKSSKYTSPFPTFWFCHFGRPGAGASKHSSSGSVGGGADREAGARVFAMSAGAVIALDAKKRKMHRYSSTNEVGSASSGKGPDAVAVAVAVAVHGDGIVDNRYVVSRGLRKVPLDHLPDSDPRKKKEKNARKRKKNKLKKKNK